MEESELEPPKTLNTRNQGLLVFNDTKVCMVGPAFGFGSL